MEDQELERPLKVAEFAAAARLSRNAVYELIARGELPAVKIGRQFRLPRGFCARMLKGEHGNVAADR